MNVQEIRWLTWGAIAHRPAHSPRWDEPGTLKAITEVCGTWTLEVATTHVLAHARDAKAKTPYAITGNPPANEAQRPPRYPPKAADECRNHPGEWADQCRICHGPQVADEQPGDRDTRPGRSNVSERVAELRRLKAGESA